MRAEHVRQDRKSNHHPGTPGQQGMKAGAHNNGQDRAIYVITTKTQQSPSILNNFVGWALPNTKQTFQDMIWSFFLMGDAHPTGLFNVITAKTQLARSRKTKLYIMDCQPIPSFPRRRESRKCFPCGSAGRDLGYWSCAGRTNYHSDFCLLPPVSRFLSPVF